MYINPKRSHGLAPVAKDSMRARRSRTLVTTLVLDNGGHPITRAGILNSHHRQPTIKPKTPRTRNNRPAHTPIVPHSMTATPVCSRLMAERIGLSFHPPHGGFPANPRRALAFPGTP